MTQQREEEMNNNEDNGGSSIIVLPLIAIIGGWYLNQRYDHNVILLVTICVVAYTSLLYFLNSDELEKSNEAKKENFEAMNASGILIVLKNLEENKEEEVHELMKETREKESRLVCIECLTALAIQCNRRQQYLKKKSVAIPDDDDDDSIKYMVYQYQNHELELTSQECCHVVLRRHPDNDAILSSALSLLSLVAGDSQVRNRILREPNDYGVKIPIGAVRHSLSKIKTLDETKLAEDMERLSAEVQRLGCLYLGALSDESSSSNSSRSGDDDTTQYLSKSIANQVVKSDGLSTILDSIHWYRYHSEVAKWSLWALFVICYDSIPSQVEFVKCNGIQRTCQVMKDIPDVVEVHRHGIALLFDVMRERIPQELQQQQQQQQQFNFGNDTMPTLDVTKVRIIGLNAGVHQVVLNSMKCFGENMEIMMMGRQILLSTGYSGEEEIPEFQNGELVNYQQ